MGKMHRIISPPLHEEASGRCIDCGLECAPRPKRAGGKPWWIRWRMPGEAWKVQPQPRPCGGQRQS